MLAVVNSVCSCFFVVLKITESTLQRFWGFVDKKGPTADHLDSRCWIWTGAVNASGYGRFSVDGRTVYAHRFAFLLGSGELPEQVLHQCNNPRCCRFNHLGAGDNHLNLIDQLVRRIKDRDLN